MGLKGPSGGPARRSPDREEQPKERTRSRDVRDMEHAPTWVKERQANDEERASLKVKRRPDAEAAPRAVAAKGRDSDRVVIILDEIDPKKNSVRFNTSDKEAAVTSIYINNSGIPNRSYNRVRLTIEFLDDRDPD